MVRCSTTVYDPREHTTEHCDRPVVATIVRKGGAFYACEACLPDWLDDPKNTVTRLDGEPAPSVCARRNPSCDGWQRWRHVGGNVYHARTVPLQVCKSERTRWGRCCEKAASAWMHDPPSVGEVWALAEKRERQRDQAIEHADAWQREANAARVGAAEAAADLARLQDAARHAVTTGTPEAMAALRALLPLEGTR